MSSAINSCHKVELLHSFTLRSHSGLEKMRFEADKRKRLGWVPGVLARVSRRTSARSRFCIIPQRLHVIWQQPYPTWAKSIPYAVFTINKNYLSHQHLTLVVCACLQRCLISCNLLKHPSISLSLSVFFTGVSDEVLATPPRWLCIVWAGWCQLLSSSWHLGLTYRLHIILKILCLGLSAQFD